MPLSSRPINRDDPTASAKRIAASLRCSRANSIPSDCSGEIVEANGQGSNEAASGTLPRAADDHVRYWHAADIDPLTKDVLFQVQSGHQVKAHRCLEMTQTGHKDLFDHFVSAGEDLRR